MTPFHSAPLEHPPRNLKWASERIRGPSSGHGRPQLRVAFTIRLEALTAVIQMPEGRSGYSAANAGLSHAQRSTAAGRRDTTVACVLVACILSACRDRCGRGQCNILKHYLTAP